MILKEKILREQSELKLCRNEDREKKGERERARKTIDMLENIVLKKFSSAFPAIHFNANWSRQKVKIEFSLLSFS